MASTENGTTQYSGVITNLVTPTGVFNPTGHDTKLVTTFSTLMSQYSSGEYGITSNGGSQLAVPANPAVIINYYKMRGFYSIGGVYETWVLTDAPSVTPPSGHVLNNVAIEAFWQS